VHPSSTNTENRKRVLSGMRPTGRLHIGHYFGALQNWIKLQNDPQYECFFFIADWHALTSDYADTSQVAQNTIEIARGLAGGGLTRGAARCSQSAVPEHAELQLLLSMVTPLASRTPLIRKRRQREGQDLHAYGFLISRVADGRHRDVWRSGERSGRTGGRGPGVARRALARSCGASIFYGLAVKNELFAPASKKSLVSLLNKVGWPVNVAGGTPTPEPVTPERVQTAVRKHAAEMGLENFMNAIGDLRRFISLTSVLREPEAMLTKTPRIPGTDGRKMSKSYGNFISLSESDESIRSKTKAMVTDPARKRRTDPGDPDKCPAYDWHKLFSPQETLDWAANGCRTAGIGCIECKAAMADHLIKWIEPVRQRRQDYEQSPQHVLEILDTGSKLARMEAQQTMDRVREAVFGWDKLRANLAAPSRGAQNVKAGG
jgi:tryptophanyl-tRNA synthetase